RVRRCVLRPAGLRRCVSGSSHLDSPRLRVKRSLERSSTELLGGAASGASGRCVGGSSHRNFPRLRVKRSLERSSTELLGGAASGASEGGLIQAAAHAHRAGGVGVVPAV